MPASYQEKEINDVVVIGGGLMGSSAAWQLSKYGEDVLLIEQQSAIYSSGSSFGEARISRSLGPKDDIFSYLQKQGIIETQKLIDFLNQEDGEQHSMEDIYTTSPVTYIYYDHLQADVDELLDGQMDKYEYAATPQEANNLFGVQALETARIIREYKKYSGTMNPKALIHKLQKGIQLKGNTIRYNSKVTSLIRKGELYEIKISDSKTGQSKTILTKRIVSAAGPYTGELLEKVAPYFSEIINPQRVFLGYFKIAKDRYAAYTVEQKKKIMDFYPVADFTPDIMFSMIEKIDEDGIPILKIGGHFKRSDITNLDEVWGKKLSEEEIAWSRKSTLKYLNFLNIPIESSELELVNSYSCVYSLTKSEVPLVTNILAEDGRNKNPDIVVIAGMSGVGAKGALAYGKLAADLLHKKEDNSPMYQKTRRALGFERLPEDEGGDDGVRIFGRGIQ